MPWVSTFHKFPNKAAFDSAFAAWAPKKGTVEVDVLSLVMKNLITIDAITLIKITIPIEVTGYHVNIARKQEVALPASFSAVILSPKAPRRVWS